MAQHESTADNTNNIFKCKHVDRLRVDIVERLKVEAGLGKAKAAEVDDERCDTCAFHGHVVRKRGIRNRNVRTWELDEDLLAEIDEPAGIKADVCAHLAYQSRVKC